MVKDKGPILGTLILLGVLLAALAIFQPYTADWPGSGYAEPARRYIRAAMHHDSAALVRLSTSDSPVRWALAVSRRYADTLAHWDRRMHAYTGEQRGDTTEVFVYPYEGACDDEPIVLRFVNSGADPKVLEASSACLNAGGSPR